MMQATADPGVNKSILSPNCSASSANLDDSFADAPVGETDGNNDMEHGCQKGSQLKKKKKKKKKKNRHLKPNVCQRPLLRPAGSQVPRAPENSTQFIMDDHMNSDLFYNFDSNKETSEEELEIRTPQTFNDYVILDFEHAYRFAHEESLMSSNIDELKSAIISLENRRANLQHTIQSRPSVLLDNLQNMLITLQEQHRHLQQENQELMHPNKESTCHSQNSDSDSSSTSSGSDSSDSNSDDESKHNH